MRAIAIAFLVLMPLQALALSCMEPSVARTYGAVDEAKEEYVIVEGRLTLDDRSLPRTGGVEQNPPRMTRIPARLTGKSMSRTGFNTPFDKPVTLEVACFGPWCGGAQNGMEVLAFVKRVDGKHTLSIDPCGGHVFANKKKLRREVLTCFKGGNCSD